MRDRDGSRLKIEQATHYRWNGENVSAGEVREHIARTPGVTDVTIHAVKLDGYDGRAGAAAITLAPSAQRKEDTFQSIFV